MRTHCVLTCQLDLLPQPVIAARLVIKADGLPWLDLPESPHLKMLSKDQRALLREPPVFNSTTNCVAREF
jgi:hypothetical protein